MDICIKGARAICNAVGENPKQINFLVERLGLPAWRRGGAGSWRALPEDLKRWMLAQRNSHLGGPPLPDTQGEASGKGPAKAGPPTASAVAPEAAAPSAPGAGAERRPTAASPGQGGAPGRQHPLPVPTALGCPAGVHG